MTRRLITEADVRHWSGAEIIVDERTIITPSALDRAFERGIAVRFSRESGGRTPATTGGVTLSLPATPGQDYLVRVKPGAQVEVLHLRDDGVTERLR